MARRASGIGDEGRRRAFERIEEALNPQRPGVDIETSTYPVIQVVPDDDPRLYGQGPTKSTRVARHKFVPNPEPSYGTPEELLRGLAGLDTVGTVYVEFWKMGKNGKQWAYKNVPKSIYDQFSNNNSKGHFINTTLNNYEYGPESW